jgi:hypothetical protein
MRVVVVENERKHVERLRQAQTDSLDEGFFERPQIEKTTTLVSRSTSDRSDLRWGQTLSRELRDFYRTVCSLNIDTKRHGTGDGAGNKIAAVGEIERKRSRV